MTTSPISAETPTSSDLGVTEQTTVEVVRSRRRKKTIEAYQINGGLRIAIPASLSKSEEAHWVQTMVERFRRPKNRPARSDENLMRRAKLLARRYDLPTPGSIKWGGESRTQWASCTAGSRAIRLTGSLQSKPAWVVDYVIVHELAHLLVPAHNREFWALVKLYPRAERARGYLLAMEATDITQPDYSEDGTRDSRSASD